MFTTKFLDFRGAIEHIKALTFKDILTNKLPQKNLKKKIFHNNINYSRVLAKKAVIFLMHLQVINGNDYRLCNYRGRHYLGPSSLTTLCYRNPWRVG